MDVRDETVAVIEKYNRLDTALYRHARDRLQEQIRQHGEPLERELRSFERLNRLLGRGYILVASAIDHLRGARELRTAKVRGGVASGSPPLGGRWARLAPDLGSPAPEGSTLSLCRLARSASDQADWF
jgi:hypothetical protein